MKNNKLSLNKQIMANLNNQAMGEVKGGLSWEDLVTIGLGMAIQWAISKNFDDRGACLSDKCSSPKWCGPFTGDCPDTEPGECIW